ncbi:hypothetical protein ACN42_g9529 [Penicillium freii]|uniref:Uncharacterized protein n=1 Tax=Penicillium freii TaxID=48697 RepID=A0A117NLG6_PENFR|nr:hypothetical protein ACN42_g9529 [Penicillium freii]
MRSSSFIFFSSLFYSHPYSFLFIPSLSFFHRSSSGVSTSNTVALLSLLLASYYNPIIFHLKTLHLRFTSSLFHF